MQKTISFLARLFIIAIVCCSISPFAQDNTQTVTDTKYYEPLNITSTATITGPIMVHPGEPYDIIIEGVTSASMCNWHLYENGAVIGSQSLVFGSTVNKTFERVQTEPGNYTYTFYFRGIQGAHNWPDFVNVTITVGAQVPPPPPIWYYKVTGPDNSVIVEANPGDVVYFELDATTQDYVWGNILALYDTSKLELVSIEEDPFNWYGFWLWWAPDTINPAYHGGGNYYYYDRIKNTLISGFGSAWAQQWVSWYGDGYAGPVGTDDPFYGQTLPDKQALAAFLGTPLAEVENLGAVRLYTATYAGGQYGASPLRLGFRVLSQGMTQFHTFANGSPESPIGYNWNWQSLDSYLQSTVEIVSMDNIPPVTTFVIDPEPNINGWNSTDVNITLTAVDTGDEPSGIQAIYYNINNAPEWNSVPYNNVTFTVSEEGATTVKYYAMDNAGNAEDKKSFDVLIDKTPPVIVPGSENIKPGVAADGGVYIIWGEAIEITKDVSDNLSGAIGGEVILKDANGDPVKDANGNPVKGYLVPIAGPGSLRKMQADIQIPPDLPPGQYTLEQVVEDYAGNKSTPTPVTVFIVPPPAPPTQPPTPPYEPPGQPPDRPPSEPPVTPPGPPIGWPPIKPWPVDLKEYCNCRVVSFGIFGAKPINPAIIWTGDAYTHCGLKIGLEVVDSQTNKELVDIDDWYVGCVGIHVKQGDEGFEYSPCLKKAKTPAKINDELTITWQISGNGKLESNDASRANVYISDLEIGIPATVKIAALINDKRGHDGDKGYITYEFSVIRTDITEYSITPLSTEVVIGTNKPPKLPPDTPCPENCCNPDHVWRKGEPIKLGDLTDDEKYIPVDVPVTLKVPSAKDLDQLLVWCDGGPCPCAPHWGLFNENEIPTYNWTAEPRGAGDFPPHSAPGMGKEEVFVASKPGNINFKVTVNSSAQGKDIAKEYKFGRTAVKVDLDIIKPDGREMDEDKEEKEGEAVNVNIDDDDNDGGAGGHGQTVIISDKDDTNGVSGENDLVKLYIHRIEPQSVAKDGKYKIIYSDAKINLWKNPNKTEKIISEQTEFNPAQDTTIYVEGKSPHANTGTGLYGDIIILAFYVGDKKIAVDKVRIIVAEMIFAIMGDGETGKYSLTKYLDGAKKDNRTDPHIIKGKNTDNKDTYYSVAIYSSEKMAKVALQADGGYVVYDGHSNFGIGPVFASGKTNISQFMNTGNDLHQINWPYMREEQGHPGFDIAYSEYGDDTTTEEQYDPVIYNYKIKGTLTPTYDTVRHASSPVPGGYNLTFIKGTERWQDHHIGSGDDTRIVAKCGAVDMPAKRWKKIFLNGCYTGQYYFDIYNQGVLFYTHDEAGASTTTREFVRAVVAGKNNAQINKSLDDIEKVNDYYVFN